MTRKALGRGLGALIPTAPPVPSPEQSPGTPGDGDARRLLSVAIDDLVPNRQQPRRDFQPDALDELVASIRNHGILLPLVVRRMGGQFEIVAGERRWRAAQRAGLSHVPAVAREADDATSLELALVENIQRQDLNPIEVAHAYEQLQLERGWTQEELAEHVGMSRPSVANLMRLLKLPRQVQQQVRVGALGMGHARALLGLPTAALMSKIGAEVEAKRLSVRQAEERVRRVRRGEDGAVPRRAAGDGFGPQRRLLEEQLRSRVGTRVRIQGSTSRGHIELHYFSSDELDALLERLGARG
jgi:ParB family chromosome partitioning protein